MKVMTENGMINISSDVFTNIAGAAADIQDLHPRSCRLQHSPDQELFPALLHSKAYAVIRAVIALRNGFEHTVDALFLFPVYHFKICFNEALLLVRVLFRKVILPVRQ